MDSFNEPSVKRIIGMFSAQVAKTTIIENVIAYHAHHDPSPIMAVFPTLEIAESFSKDRLAPMVRDTPALQKRFAEAGSKTSGDTLLHKRFHGGHITLAGANSFNSLASRPIRIVLGDEAAKWKTNEKGSPFRQVSVRVRAYWNSKVAYFSTPTDPNSEFHKVWEESDKRLFEIPCPHCGVYVVMVFDENASSIPTEAVIENIAVLRWVEGKPIKSQTGSNIRRADDAWFECLSCNGRIDDVARHQAVQAGRWFATAEFYGTAGFWGWQGISPFSQALGIANEWLGALGSSVELQSVKNETLGLPWVERGDSPDWKKLFDRKADYQIGTVQDGALILTAGADVQPDRIEVQVIGRGRRKQRWLVDYLILYGDTSRTEVWQELTTVLGTVYQDANGNEFTIKKLAIDSGFATNQVYAWARQQKYGPVSVIKGGPASMSAIVGPPSPVEVTLGGKRLDVGVKVSLVNVSELKKQFYGWLHLDLPNLEKGEQYPDGFFHFCATPDTEEYCKQLTAEQLMTRTVKGYQKREWEKTRPRNEALDTCIYALAAEVMLNLDRYQDHHWDRLEQALGIKKPTPPVAPQAATPVASNPPRRAREVRFRFNNN